MLWVDELEPSLGQHRERVSWRQDKDDRDDAPTIQPERNDAASFVEPLRDHVGAPRLVCTPVAVATGSPPVVASDQDRMIVVPSSS